MRMDCFLRQSAATSSHFACCARPQAMRVPASCLPRLAHKGETHRHSTFAASFPSLEKGVGRGVLLCPDKESPYPPTSQKFLPPPPHYPQPPTRHLRHSDHHDSPQP